MAGSDGTGFIPGTLRADREKQEGKKIEQLENAMVLKAEFESLISTTPEKSLLLQKRKDEFKEKEQELFDISKEIIHERLILLQSSLDILLDGVKLSKMDSKTRSESLIGEYAVINRPKHAIYANTLRVTPYISSPEVGRIAIVSGRNRYFRRYFKPHAWVLSKNLAANHDIVDTIAYGLAMDIKDGLFPVEPFLDAFDSVITRYASRAGKIFCDIIADQVEYRNELIGASSSFEIKANALEKQKNDLRNKYILETQPEGEQ